MFTFGHVYSVPVGKISVFRTHTPISNSTEILLCAETWQRSSNQETAFKM
jgi:hypothetical protein